MSARQWEIYMKKVCGWSLLLFTAFLLVTAGCRSANPLLQEVPPEVSQTSPTVASTNLPAVATPPPEEATPPDEPALPLPPLVLNGSQPQGTDAVVGELTYDPNFLLRIDARRVDAPDEPGAGIAAVEFRISSAAGELLHTYTDNTPGYCIFGGGEPTCNGWPLVDGVFRWGEGGPPIEAGQYNGLAIFHYTPYGGDGYGGVTEESWRFSFEIAGP